MERERSTTIIRFSFILAFLVMVVPLAARANDTLYFRMKDCIQSVKAGDGTYSRKVVHTKDSGWLALDYDDSSRLVMRSYYSDTTFRTKLYKQYLYSPRDKYCAYIRSYKDGRLDGVNVAFGERGDTLWKQTFKDNKLISTWISPTYKYKEIIYGRAEFDAEYPGGPSRWAYYLGKNFNYPKQAIKKEIQGTVLVLFVVTSEGDVTDVEVLKSVHPLLDEEAMRLIKSSARWKPARWDGIKVAQFKAQPVVFRLEEQRRMR